MNKLRLDGSCNFSGSFSKNYSSSLYSLIGQKVADIEKVPIFASTLKFKDAKVEQKFIQSLFCNSDANLNASSEFKFNLMFLYIFISAYIIATAVQDLFLFREFLLSTQVYVFKTVFLGIISVLFFSVLNATLKSILIVKRATEIFTILAFIIISYVVLTDTRVLSAVSSSSRNKLEIFHSTLCVFLLVAGFSRLLFDNFFNVLIISFFAFISTSLSLILSVQENLVQTVPELLFLLIGLVTICFNSHKHSVFSRDFFWRNEIKNKNIEELSEITEFNDLGNKNYINTEIELLVQLCEKIKKCIKGAYSLLIFKDVKAKLKVALNELDNLKKRITGDIFKHAVFVGEAEMMDEQDRTFINQFFMQFSHKSPNYSKLNTLRDYSDASPTCFFNKYGIRNFEKALEAIGTDWAFDIWFIYQSTGHNIFILSRYLSEKWGISEEFSIPEDIFDRFFQSVEKVRNI
jgi:hypothetical protein